MPTLHVINPATAKRLATLPADHPGSVKAKVAAARAAQPRWAAAPLRERLAILRRFRDAVSAETDDLAELLTAETGKPITQARNELRGLLPRVDFFLERTAAAMRPETAYRDRKAGLHERISWEPLGVVANISAWNYPWFVSGNVLLPALLTGNAVVYKPSEFASLTGLAFVERLHASGVPKDVLAPVIGTGDAGAALLRAPVDGVFFTGSYATGRRIARTMAGRMMRLQLELGGKDPVYVCDDVDLATAAASTADGAFYNNGQSCCAIERLYVHAAIFDRFVASFVDVVKGFKAGDPRRATTYLSVLTRPAQVPVLAAQVADAKAKGARVLLGGKPTRDRRGFEPTVLVDVNHRMAIMREESFGPVIGIMRVRDDAEAVALMNDSPYGLTAGVYCREPRRAEAILRQVRSGSSYWNCCDRVSPRLPWSGVGHSGIGVTLSQEGIRAFLRPRAWHLRAA